MGETYRAKGGRVFISFSALLDALAPRRDLLEAAVAFRLYAPPTLTPKCSIVVTQIVVEGGTRSDVVGSKPPCTDFLFLLSKYYQNDITSCGVACAYRFLLTRHSAMERSWV